MLKHIKATLEFSSKIFLDIPNAILVTVQFSS